MWSPSRTMITPADAGDPDLVRPEELAQERRRGAQEDEDRAEARHEEERVDHRPAPVHAPLQVLQAHPGDEGQVAGHQGKHARGQEGQHPRGERDQDADIVHGCLSSSGRPVWSATYRSSAWARLACASGTDAHHHPEPAHHHRHDPSDQRGRTPPARQHQGGHGQRAQHRAVFPPQLPVARQALRRAASRRAPGAPCRTPARSPALRPAAPLQPFGREPSGSRGALGVSCSPGDGGHRHLPPGGQDDLHRRGQVRQEEPFELRRQTPDPERPRPSPSSR